jgi:hypothetical protein
MTSLLAKLFRPRTPTPLARLAELTPPFKPGVEHWNGMNEPNVITAGAERVRLAHDALAALRATAEDARVRVARAAGLPRSAAVLDADAVPLLRGLLDDEALCSALGNDAVELWLNIDRLPCIRYALPRADEWSPDTLIALLCRDLDDAEVFDVIAPRWRRDGRMRARLAGTRQYRPQAAARAVVRDRRFVDLALETLAVDFDPACRLLGLQASPRAVEELQQILDRVQTLDMRTLTAVEAMLSTTESQYHGDMLAKFIRSHRDLCVEQLVGSFLAPRVARSCGALLQHESLRHDDVLLARLRTCEANHLATLDTDD